MSLLKYWLWLSNFSGMKWETRARLLEYFDDPEAIYYADSADYKAALGYTGGDATGLANKSMDTVKRVMEDCANLGVGIITLRDAMYPTRLRNIENPPLVLYIKGRLPILDEEAAVAVVGTRRATPYGRKMGQLMGYEITKGGGLVVSGLAEGVDSAGAKGALQAGGSCVGVLGTAINEVYPKSNVGLFADVEAVGALVSEYPPGYPTGSGNFPQRNRIMSGISVGVVIVEAPMRSGALITANLALEQGRDVFVVPANVDAVNSMGSNELMKDAAKPVMNGWDVLCEYDRIYPDKIVKSDVRLTAAMLDEIDKASEEAVAKAARSGSGGSSEIAVLREPSTKKVIDKGNNEAYIDIMELSELNENQQLIVMEINKTSTAMHVDDIILATKLPAQTVLAELMMLQIKDIIKDEGGKQYSVNLLTR